MEEKEEERRFSLFRRKSSKKDHGKQFGGLSVVGERLSTMHEKSATLPSQPNSHEMSAMTQSPSGGLFSKLKRRFRFRSKGRYDFKDYDRPVQRLRRKSDDPMRVSEQEDMEIETVAKVTSSVKTPRRAQNDKENVILIRKDRCVSVICKDENGSAEVIFSNMPTPEENDNASESWGEGGEEDPYATINSVKEEIQERFSPGMAKSEKVFSKEERDRAKAKELLQYSMASSSSNNVSNAKPSTLECVNVEDLYAKINSKTTKDKKSEDESSSSSGPQTPFDLNRFVAAKIRSRLDHDYETLEDVKKRVSELSSDKTEVTTPLSNDFCTESTSCADIEDDDEFEIEPDYETLEEVRQKVHRASVGEESIKDEKSVQMRRKVTSHYQSIDPKESNEDPSKPNSTITTSIVATTSTGTTSDSTTNAPSKTSPSGKPVAPLAISVDSTLSTANDKTSPSSADCIYDNPNVILRKQFFRYSLGATLSPHNRHSLVLFEPPLIKKTPAEEELVEKLSSQLAPPLPLRNYQKEEAGKSSGAGGARHSWSSMSSNFWDMSGSWHGGTEMSNKSCVGVIGLTKGSLNMARSKSQEFSEESIGNSGIIHNMSSSNSNDNELGVNSMSSKQNEKEVLMNGATDDMMVPISVMCNGDVIHMKDGSSDKKQSHSTKTDDAKCDVNSVVVNKSDSENTDVIKSISSSALSNYSEEQHTYEKDAEKNSFNETVCVKTPLNNTNVSVIDNISGSFVESKASIVLSSTRESTVTQNHRKIKTVTSFSHAVHMSSSIPSSFVQSSLVVSANVTTPGMADKKLLEINVPIDTSRCSDNSDSCALRDEDCKSRREKQLGASKSESTESDGSKDSEVQFDSPKEKSGVTSLFSSLSTTDSQSCESSWSAEDKRIDEGDKESVSIQSNGNGNDNESDGNVVSLRKKGNPDGSGTETKEWRKKRKSGPNASPDQDMAEISKAFERGEFQYAFSEEYNSSEVEEEALEGRRKSENKGCGGGCGVEELPSHSHSSDGVDDVSSSPKKADYEKGSTAPLCGCEVYNDDSGCHSHDVTNIGGGDNADVGRCKGKGNDSHRNCYESDKLCGLKINGNSTDINEIENPHSFNVAFADEDSDSGSAQFENGDHINSQDTGSAVPFYDEKVSKSNFIISPSQSHNGNDNLPDQHFDLTSRQNENHELFFEMTRLLENVINGFCQTRMALDMSYLVAGVFKWARCFNLSVELFSIVDDKLKHLLDNYRSDLLAKWNFSTTTAEEVSEREKLQLEVDNCHKQIQTILKSYVGLPTFLDVRLNLLGTFLLQYEYRHPEFHSTIIKPEATRISQEELTMWMQILSSDSWTYRRNMNCNDGNDGAVGMNLNSPSGYPDVRNRCEEILGRFYNCNESCTHIDTTTSQISTSTTSPSTEEGCTTFSSSEFSPSSTDWPGFETTSSRTSVLYEFLNMCDSIEDSDEEEESETVRTYIKTVTVPSNCNQDGGSFNNTASVLSLCRAFHGELAYCVRTRMPQQGCNSQTTKESNCSGKNSHLSNSAWQEMDHLMKKLIPYISPRLDFQYLLRTYAEFKFFILKDRQKYKGLRKCFLIQRENELQCTRHREMVFMKLIRDELQHFANVVRHSIASESLFLEDRDVGFSLNKLLRISLTTLNRMRYPYRQCDLPEQSPSNNEEDSLTSEAVSPDDAEGFVNVSVTVTEACDDAVVGANDDEGDDNDRMDVAVKKEEVEHGAEGGVGDCSEDSANVQEMRVVTLQEIAEFHIENYRSFRAGCMWSDLDAWQSPEVFLDDPNVLDLKMRGSFIVDRDTNAIHSHSTWGHYEEPKPLQERDDFLESMQQLQLKEWYWGPLSYDQAASVLRSYEDGSFLVRDSSDRKYLLSLSFKSLGEVYHTRIEHAKGLFSFWSQPDSHGKARICEFIEKSVQNSHDGKFLYFLRPMDVGNPPLPIRLLNPVSRNFRIPSLRHLARFVIRQSVRKDHIDFLPVPQKVKGYLRQKQFYVEFRGNERWSFEGVSTRM